LSCGQRVPLQRHWRRAFLLILILVQQILGSLGQSTAFDEVYHVSAEYAFWRTRKMLWMREEHTLLIRQFVALPLLFLNPQLPQNVDNRGDFARKFFFDNTVDPDTMLFWSYIGCGRRPRYAF